jgi:large subunit ribosomal protein L4
MSGPIKGLSLLSRRNAGEMAMQVPVRNMAGETVGEIELRDRVFGIEPNVAVMYQALLRQQANARLGTHKTKTRAEVRGGGRKPWRQKGTGRARQGSIRAPQWRGGGTVFGPQPRSYAQRMNRKMRRLALRSALSVKAQDDQVVVMEHLEMPSPKTREMSALLQRLNLDASVLILLPKANENVELSTRNLPNVKTLRANCLSVRDILGYDYVVLTQDAVDMVHTLLDSE